MPNTEIDPESGCYICTLSPLPGGYVEIRLPHEYAEFGGGQNNARPREYIHRLVWKIWVGPIPAKWTIDHVEARGCTSQACWNLLHLEAVPHQINAQRRGHPCGENCHTHRKG